jgi:quinol---cytochrome c reductase cytochrome c subunit, bacillus type
VPRMTARERRESYNREHDFQTRTGKAFMPYALFHDAVVSLITVGLILGLAIVWHAGFGHVNPDPEAGRAGGFLGPAYENEADPGTESYDPRPEWYFFFLFQLLRIFSNPNLLLMATIIIPTILMVLLLAWPFIDRGPERRVSRRPAAMVLGVATPILARSRTTRGRPHSRTRCRAAPATRSPTPAPAVRWARTSTARSRTTTRRSTSSRTARAACRRSRPRASPTTS